MSFLLFFVAFPSQVWSKGLQVGDRVECRSSGISVWAPGSVVRVDATPSACCCFCTAHAHRVSLDITKNVIKSYLTEDLEGSIVTIFIL